MYCSKCGYRIEQPGKFCPKCGNPTSQTVNKPQPPIRQNVNSSYTPPQSSQPQYNNTPQYGSTQKKKGKGCITTLVVFGVIIMLLGLISVLNSNRIHAVAIDYDDFRDNDTPFTIDVTAEGDSVEYEIDIVGLNNYSKSIDLDEMFSDVFGEKYKIHDMCFDTETNSVYLLAQKNNGKYIDVEYTYEADFTDESIKFDVLCDKLGKVDSLLCMIRSAPFMSLETMEILVPSHLISIVSSVDDDPITHTTIHNSLILEYDADDTKSISISATTTPEVTTQPIQGGDAWTVMIYMNGADLEYTSETNTYDASGSDDIGEMLSADLSEDVNILIETGGTLSWYRDDIDGDHNQRFEISDGNLVKLDDLDRKNMCDPDTLISFADWAVKNYPANNYALILWDHGGGSLYGFGYDEYYPTDSLLLSEIESALSQVTSSNQMKFELIGFDACLMGTVETAKTISPYANYYLASEESEPGHGWNYSYLVDIISQPTTTNGEILGSEIVYGFISEATNMDSVDTITLSNIDLSQMDNVSNQFSNLIELINNDMAQDEKFKNNVLSTIPKLMEFSETDHYDLVGFAREMTKYYPSEANRLIEAIDKAVVANGAGYNMSAVGGLSLYIPYYDLNLYSEFRDLYSDISISDNYVLFCDTVTNNKQVAIENAVDPDYTIDTYSRPFTITFTQDYYDNYLSNVYINVYEIYIDGDNEYWYDYGYDAWVEETDTPYVFEEYVQYWPCFMEYPLYLVVEYADDSIIKYSAPITVNNQDCDMLFTYYHDDASYNIEGYVYYQNDTSISDRIVYQFETGDVVSLGYYVTEINSMNEDWFYTDGFTITDENFFVEDLVLADGSYAMQFAIEDYTGEMFFTEITEFEFTTNE